MKTRLTLSMAAALLSLSTFTPQLSTVFAQGSLTPPGAPAPSMKTLAQIEPRIAITNSASAVTISQPGSYYLTTNITVSSGNAITIAASGVTLDLNGFTITSTAASATGRAILLESSLHDITIYNGHIRGGVTNNGSGVYSGSGFAFGISYSGNPPGNVLVSRVSVSGCLTYGIYLSANYSTVVEACTVRTVGNLGVYASIIKGSLAIDCGFHAIYGDQVSDCRGDASSTGNGVTATIAQTCVGSSGSGIGVSAGRLAIGCYGSSSTGTGLHAQNAAFCTGSRPGGTAIQATIANGCYAASGTNLITHKYSMP